MNDQTLRVLVVDADESSCEPLAAFLRQHGFHVVDTVADAMQALEYVKQSEEPYHVALIDEVLTPHPRGTPQRLGVQLMQQIQANSPQTEVARPHLPLFRRNVQEDEVCHAIPACLFREL